MSDRKYRQRGYQDSGAGGEKRGPAGPPRERPEGPRGRGLGRPTASVWRCAACGKVLPSADDVGLTATCPHCGADLHSCSQCAHFDPSARLECRQKIPAPVRTKTKANRCLLFAPKLVQEFAKEARRDPDDPRAAFDDLFKL